MDGIAAETGKVAGDHGTTKTAPSGAVFVGWILGRPWAGL